MKIYHFHPETMEYIGDGIADESPLEPGVWLIPANATTEPPPAHVDGKKRCFEFGAWVLRDIPPPPPPVTKTQEELAAEAIAATKAKLVDIDLRSIRAIREYIVQLPDAPQILKDRELEAIAERSKLGQQ